MTQQITVPSRELVLEVRIGFIRQGTTLNAWCRDNGVLIGAARQALIGVWDGPKGRAMRRRIVRASGADIRVGEAA